MSTEPERPDGDQPAEGQPAEQVPEDAGHRPEGLDLARSAHRSAAAVPGQPARRRSRPTPSGGPEPKRRGGRGRASGAHPDDRDPQLLGPTLERLVQRHGWELDLRVQGVFGRWAELVGAEVADHCTPETFDDGRLVVRTDSTAWATQLRLLAPTVVRRLNEELGHGTVTFLDVQGPHLPSWTKGRRSTRDGRGPRDTYG